MRFSAPYEDVAVLSSGFSRQDMNGIVHGSCAIHDGCGRLCNVTNVTKQCQTRRACHRLIFEFFFLTILHFILPRYILLISSMEYLPEADSYINESERNVHVWCSIVRPCTYNSKNLMNKPTLGLIAGKLCAFIHTYLVPLSSRLLRTQ